MIEILKKRYKVGDIITLHTEENSFTGTIDSFEETCVILNTEDGEEFIANEIIKRISVPKPISNIKDALQLPKDKLKQNTVVNVAEINKSLEKDIELNEGKTIDLIIPKVEYKVGDKIPLDELAKRSGKQVKAKLPKAINKGITLGSLADLSQLILPEIEAENKRIVSANGTITKYFGDRTFGFITDKFGYDLWFGFNSIIDDDLRKSLMGTFTRVSIPILFTTSKNYKGDSAILIHKPKSVEKMIELAKKYAEKEKKTDTAIGILDQILISYPENYLATKLRTEIIGKQSKTNFPNSTFKTYDLNYQKAVKLKNNDKNYEQALKYYFLAFENRSKRESCIKDIGMLYVSMGETAKALEFIKQHESELPVNVTTFYYLENFYSSAKDFKKVLEYVDLLVKEKTVYNDKRKHSMLLAKKGFALIQLNDFESARNILEESISYQPDNTYANRLLTALDEPDKEEFNQLIADAEFDSFGGGLSNFIKETLDSYNNYFGVPAKVIDSGAFTKETLSSIRRLIETAGKSRSRERANYLLTEAKLMLTLEPERDNATRSIIARYCNAMALNHISENSSMDVIRFYYLEAFSLEEDYPRTAPQVALYLISLKSTYSELINISTKTPSVDDALKMVIVQDTKENVWESILSMFLWNRSISAQITSKLFSNKLYRDQSIVYLKNLGLYKDELKNIESYSNLWNQAREKRQRDYSRWLASLKGIYNNENLETLISQLLESLNEAKKSWLNQLDTSRLNIISKDIYEVIGQYLRQTGYRDKERSYNFSKAQINQLINEIKEKPTKFSFEGYLPVLEKLDILLDKSFKTIEAASNPKVKVSILGEASVVGINNNIEFQVSIENSKDSSPIRDIKVTVQNNADIIFIEKNNQYFDSIDGSEHCILRLSVQISDKIIQDKAATLDVVCEYKTRNQENPTIIDEQLSLRLYSEEEFDAIDNPYAPIADGGPVIDKKMFFGRDEFIKNRINAILNADSKQIIIYGQKRSGKSSVLHHLKQGLEATNNTFCVQFSLGLIIKELNEFTFFHKILSTIDRELRLRKAKKETVPNFFCPTLEEFKTKYASNPANGFIEIIEDFKIASIELEGWRTKKLVVMIDEFTYLYTAIKSGSTSDSIMKQWKAITQSENAKFSVVLVGQDVVPSFKKEDYAKNAFGVIEDIRLTYLDQLDAKRLIEEPILEKNGDSRFIGNAVDSIINYTSRNPYYIQIFCARLVDYMNTKKNIRVTEADVKEVAETFIEGSQALAPEKFDNLIRAGEEHDFKEFDDEPVVKILRQIAIGSKNIGVCSRDNISLNNKELENKVLNHLVDREVLEHKQGDNYKIQVKLFQEWLLRH